MSERKLTLMILVDALRHDYAEPSSMPFLASLGREGIYARLKPPFGFEPDGSYLTGTHPEDYLGGAHFVRSPEKSQLAFMEMMPRLFDRLPSPLQFPLRKSLQLYLSKRGRSGRLRKSASYFNIPFSLMPYFEPGDAHFPDEPGFAGRVPSIFDALRDQGWGYYNHGALKYNCHADEVLRRFRQEFGSEYRFAFLFISDLDSVGHRFGPDSAQRRETAGKVDAALKAILDLAREKYPAVDATIFGDHGMLSVRRKINILDKLTPLKARAPKDYLYFLDSTFARFWYEDDAAQQEIEEVMDSVDGMIKMTAERKASHHTRYPDNRFGDTIYWAGSGAIVYPNFWSNGAAPLGMHGYPADAVDNHSLVIHSDGKEYAPMEFQEADMVDVYQTVMFSLNLPAAANTHGKALQLKAMDRT